MYDIFILIIFIIVIGILNSINKKRNKGYDRKQEYLNKKGREGEYNISYELRKLIGNGELYNSVYVPIGYNKQTEIDILLVNNYGVFVIESKNWRGTVKGELEDSEWSLESKSGIKYLSNPCKQNEYHLKKLKEYLKIKTIAYYSIVVFGYEAKIEVENNSKNTTIISIKELESFMESVMEKGEVLSNGEIRYIDNMIQLCINKDEKFKEKHVERVKSLKRRSV